METSSKNEEFLNIWGKRKSNLKTPKGESEKFSYDVDIIAKFAYY